MNRIETGVFLGVALSLAVMRFGEIGPAHAQPTPQTKPCSMHGGVWETGLIKTGTLSGPIVITSLTSSVNPADAVTVGQYLIMNDPSGTTGTIGNEWISADKFHGPMLLRAGATLKGRVTDYTSRGVIYSGCRL